MELRQHHSINIQDITDEKVLERLLSKEKYRKIYLGDDTLKAVAKYVVHLTKN